MSLSEQIIDRDYFQDLKFKISHNYQIADFYYGKYEETGEEKFLNMLMDNVLVTISRSNFSLCQEKTLDKVKRTTLNFKASACSAGAFCDNFVTN